MRRFPLWKLSMLGLALAAYPALAETTAPKADTPAKASAVKTDKAEAAESGLPKVGKKAPDFTLTGEDEKTYRLKDLRGKWVVLAFYPADFTGG